MTLFFDYKWLLEISYKCKCSSTWPRFSVGDDSLAGGIQKSKLEESVKGKAGIIKLQQK